MRSTRSGRKTRHSSMVRRECEAPLNVFGRRSARRRLETPHCALGRILRTNSCAVCHAPLLIQCPPLRTDLVITHALEWPSLTVQWLPVRGMAELSMVVWAADPDRFPNLAATGHSKGNQFPYSIGNRPGYLLKCSCEHRTPFLPWAATRLHAGLCPAWSANCSRRYGTTALQMVAVVPSRTQHPYGCGHTVHVGQNSSSAPPIRPTFPSPQLHRTRTCRRHRTSQSRS